MGRGHASPAGPWQGWSSVRSRVSLAAVLDDEEDGGVSRDENDAESDEEWKTIKSRAAALKQTKQPGRETGAAEGCFGCSYVRA